MKTKIDLKGNWRRFVPHDIPHYEPIGVITIKGQDMALFKTSKDSYVGIDDHGMTPIDGRTVSGALGKSGPKPNPDFKRVNVILDIYTLAKAKVLGEGNVSAGIRQAFKKDEK